MGRACVQGEEEGGMSEPQRWKKDFSKMSEHAEGEWIKYEDYQATLDNIERALMLECVMLGENNISRAMYERDKP